MVFSILVTMDGNNSLKRIVRSAVDDGLGLDEERGSEQEDGRKVGGDLYLDREAVDRFARAKGAEKDEGKGNASQRRKGKAPLVEEEDNKDLQSEEIGDDPCASRWRNMKEEITGKMWKMFDETGVFLCLCRHGFSLVALDMVQSGELCVCHSQCYQANSLKA